MFCHPGRIFLIPSGVAKTAFFGYTRWKMVIAMVISESTVKKPRKNKGF
jgi:hypothetical protein